MSWLVSTTRILQKEGGRVDEQKNQSQTSLNSETQSDCILTRDEYIQEKKRFDEWWEKTSEEERKTYFLKRDIQRYNNKHGELEHYDCQLCKNKGLIAVEQDGQQILTPCDCMQIRMSYARIKASGLGEKFKDCSFEKYKATDEWQRNIKESALKFVDNPFCGWFFIGGQVGAGKTHICTAIVRELLIKKLPAKYCVWTSESTVIKQNALNEGVYARMVSELSTVKVLYLDDFLRGEQTKADLDLAFKIINYRAGVSNLITIISSERTIKEICQLDEGLGSRIFEKAKDYTWSISKSEGKNYRYKKKEE